MKRADAEGLEFYGVRGPLKQVLKAELAAGNAVVEARRGEWPWPGTAFVLLKRPFLSGHRPVEEGIALHTLQDPHYWQAEYADSKNRVLLACRFD